MSLRDLNDQERGIALQCLRYFSMSGCFDLRDKYHSRLGVTKSELNIVISKWPDLQDDDSSHDDYTAVNNCFNEVCNIMTFSSDEWDKWFKVSVSEVCQAFAHWKRRTKMDASNSTGTKLS